MWSMRELPEKEEERPLGRSSIYARENYYRVLRFLSCFMATWRYVSYLARYAEPL